MAKKILIIEDEEMLKEMYQKKLLQFGYEVVSTNTAEKGLIMVQKEKPDLVLLDILLPEKNGIYFLEKLRAKPLMSRTKVVAFSNFDEPKTKRKAIELGALDYLIKTNYKPKEVVKEIKKYLK